MDKVPTIGVDLGTCNSYVGVFQKGKVEIIPNDSGELSTPSIVSFINKGRLIGKQAKNKIIFNPKNTIFAAKRLIGRKFLDKEVQEYINYLPFKLIKEPNSDRIKFQVTYKNKEEEFYVEEILAMILQNLKKSSNNYWKRS